MLHRIFVYGTLRIGGKANHQMKKARLVKSGVALLGFKMYDLGAYPVVVPAFGSENVITGDIYLVDKETLWRLDDYEGQEYKRIQVQSISAMIYVAKSAQVIQDANPIVEGDWLKHLKINYFTK